MAKQLASVTAQVERVTVLGQKETNEIMMFKELKQQVYYVVFGNFSEVALESLRTPTQNEVPSWINVQVLESAELADIKSFLQEPDTLTTLGSSPEMDILLENTQQVKSAVLITGETINSNNEKAFKDFLNISSFISVLGLTDESISIFDLNTCTLEQAEKWVRIRLAQEEYIIQHDIMVHAIREENNKLWLLTKGMIKFGQPELSIQGVEDSDYIRAHNTLNSLASFTVLSKDTILEHDSLVKTEEYPNGLHLSHAGTYGDDEYWGNVHVEITPLP